MLKRNVLFNLHDNRIMKTIEKIYHKISIAGWYKVSNLRFENDAANNSVDKSGVNFRKVRNRQ